MTRLSEVVGVLLRDIAEAQDYSNRYSRTLADEYGNDTILREFPVPGAVLSEVELELRYALNLVQQSGGRVERDLVVAHHAFESWAAKVAALLAERFQVSASREAVAEGLAAGLYRQRESILAPGNALVGQPALAAARALLREHLPEPPRGPVPEAVDAMLAEELPGLEALLQRRDELRIDYEADVIVDAGALAKLPAAVVSSVKLKAVPRGQRWVVFEPGELRLVREP